MAITDIIGMNIATIAGLIGVVLFILGMGKAYKSKSTKQTANMIAIIGIGVFVVAGLGYGPSMLTDSLGGGTTVVTQQVQTPSGAAGTVCAVEDTTVTLSSLDKYTSAATGGTHRYKINGAPALTVADAGTLTASPGDSIEILWGNGTDGTYFAALSTEVVPCVGTKTYSAERLNNGTITIEVFNEEGNIVSEGAENETLAAGDVVTLEAKLKGQYQRGLPYGGIMVVEFNGSASLPEIDDVVVEFGGSETSIPAVHTTTLGPSSKRVAYTIPAIESNQILTGSIVIDCDDTNDPSDETGDILLTLYGNDYFVNEDTGGSFDGPAVEDEDDAVTFGAAASFTIHTD